ncbi:MAG: hypothetical protein AAGA58_00020 [Verrucomicrobiota bacterium]
MSLRDSLISNELTSNRFEEFLIHFRLGWTEGTLAAECARVLEIEYKRRARREELLDFRNVGSLPLTKRIDGMVPLWLPIAQNVSRYADEILEDAFRLELSLPPNNELNELRRQLSMGFLAFFHRRHVRIDLGMKMELVLACPSTPTAGTRHYPLLLARLPFGGTATILKCEWSAKEVLAGKEADTEFAPRFVVEPRDNSKLLLREAPATTFGSRVEPV